MGVVMVMVIEMGKGHNCDIHFACGYVLFFFKLLSWYYY